MDQLVYWENGYCQIFNDDDEQIDDLNMPVVIIYNRIHHFCGTVVIDEGERQYRRWTYVDRLLGNVGELMSFFHVNEPVILQQMQDFTRTAAELKENLKKWAKGEELPIHMNKDDEVRISPPSSPEVLIVKEEKPSVPPPTVSQAVVPKQLPLFNPADKKRTYTARKYTSNTCEECKLHFSHRNLYDSHMQEVHNQNWYHCLLCPQNKDGVHPRYKSGSALRLHIKGKHERKLFNCPICPEWSSSSRNRFIAHILKNHEMRGLGITYTYCNYCGKSFPCRDNLVKHYPHCTKKKELEGYATKKVIQCPVKECGKTFSTVQYAAYHHRIKHTSEGNKFKCEQCGKQLMRKSSLVIHSYRHKVKDDKNIKEESSDEDEEDCENSSDDSYEFDTSVEAVTKQEPVSSATLATDSSS